MSIGMAQKCKSKWRKSVSFTKIVSFPSFGEVPTSERSLIGVKRSELRLFRHLICTDIIHMVESTIQSAGKETIGQIRITLEETHIYARLGILQSFPRRSWRTWPAEDKQWKMAIWIISSVTNSTLYANLYICLPLWMIVTMQIWLQRFCNVQVQHINFNPLLSWLRMGKIN